jgi:CheY-like chemotaxis protein
VDDNQDAAETLVLALRTLGHRVQVALDGPEALALATDYVPDVALLDLGLPVIDGYELAQRLRHQPGWRDVRLIALTGYGLESDRQRTKQAGFDAHLVKPIDLRTLNAELRSEKRSTERMDGDSRP